MEGCAAESSSSTTFAVLSSGSKSAFLNFLYAVHTTLSLSVSLSLSVCLFLLHLLFSVKVK